MGQVPGRGTRAGEQGCLGPDLRLERARCERCDLNDACERRRACGGVEQVVCRAPFAIEPAATRDPARRDAAIDHDEAMQHMPTERALDVYFPRKACSSADRQITCAIDRICSVAGEALSEHVGKHALGDAAAVDPHAWGAPDHAGLDVCFELTPTFSASARPRRTCRGARRRKRQRECRRKWLTEVRRVTCDLDLLGERRVDEAV